MDFIGAMSEMAETSEINGDSTFEFSEKANDKFDKIMGDDKIDSSQYERCSTTNTRRTGKQI